MFTGLANASISPWRLDWSTFGLTKLRFGFAIAGLAAAEAVHWGMKQPQWVERFTAAPRLVRWSVSYVVAVLVLLSARATMSFIYAKF
jgi:hypothetical protein